MKLMSPRHDDEILDGDMHGRIHKRHHPIRAGLVAGRFDERGERALDNARSCAAPQPTLAIAETLDRRRVAAHPQPRAQQIRTRYGLRVHSWGAHCRQATISRAPGIRQWRMICDVGDEL
jgi:hypothetical protein